MVSVRDSVCLWSLVTTLFFWRQHYLCCTRDFAVFPQRAADGLIFSWAAFSSSTVSLLRRSVSFKWTHAKIHISKPETERRTIWKPKLRPIKIVVQRSELCVFRVGSCFITVPIVVYKSYLLFTKLRIMKYFQKTFVLFPFEAQIHPLLF